MEAARFIPYHELTEGREDACDYVITRAVYEHFLAAFDDRSPIHMEDARAQAAGFARKVMHGGILNGFLSHFVGMVFPGAGSLLLSTDLRFLEPCYLDDTLRLHGRVVQRSDTHQVVVMHVSFENQTRGGIAARGKVQIRIRS